MHVFLYIILVAVEGVVVYMIFRDWQQERRRKTIRRVERELAETQQRLGELAMEHQAWLQGQALEARKALIAESFRAAQARKAGSQSNR